MAKLTAKTVLTKPPGMYADGSGLYLQVATKAARSWIYRYQLEGKRRDMGLGPVETVTLAEARERADAARKLVRDRIDPIDARRAAEAAARLQRAKAMTFQQCAEALYRRRHARMEECEARKAVDGNAHDLRLSCLWRTANRRRSNRLGHESRATDMVDKDGDRQRGCRGRIENVLDWATDQWLSDRARTRRGGVGIWKTSCRCGARYRRSNTMPRCHMPRLAYLWQRCAG